MLGRMAGGAVRQLVVGFDLDLTLIDSRPGIAATYRELSVRTGVPIDTDAVVARLGPPLDTELAMWFPAEQVPAMADAFRELYPRFAVAESPAYPGARESFAAVRAWGGRVIVITGKYGPNAELHLAHTGLSADALVGWAWEDGKVAAMTAHGVGVYVGDHTADMRAARAAGAVAVGVRTGSHTAADLADAGAHAVLGELIEFPAWLRGHLDLRARGTPLT